jgi:hypothetical protein
MCNLFVLEDEKISKTQRLSPIKVNAAIPKSKYSNNKFCFLLLLSLISNFKSSQQLQNPIFRFGLSFETTGIESRNI